MILKIMVRTGLYMMKNRIAFFNNLIFATLAMNKVANILYDLGIEFRIDKARKIICFKDVRLRFCSISIEEQVKYGQPLDTKYFYTSDRYEDLKKLILECEE